MTHSKTYNKSPRRINHKATMSKTNTGTTALERSATIVAGGGGGGGGWGGGKGGGVKALQVDDYLIEKTFVRVKNGSDVSEKFQKHSFRFTDKYNNRTVIVYLGNESEYKAIPHGNRIKNNRPHKRTMPSVLKEIKNNENKKKKKT